MMRWTFALCLALPLAGRAADWPQWMGPNRDGIWTEAETLDRLPANGPKQLWRVPCGGGYSGPAVVGNRVYLSEFQGDAPTEGPSSGQKGIERIRCLDLANGKELWKHEYAVEYRISYGCGPRCTPTVSAGKLYAVGAMGRLSCLDAASGKLLWEKDYPKQYGFKVPTWGCCGHPLVDGQQLICLVGGTGSEVVAFDKDTGVEIWKALDGDPEPGYNTPIIYDLAGRRQLIVWTATELHGLDPTNGKKLWSVGLEPKYGMAIMSPQRSGDVLFAGGVGDVCAAVKITGSAAEVLWRGDKKSGLFPINATPLIVDGYLYGPNTESAFTCVELKTGKRLWETMTPTLGEGKRGRSGTAFIVRNGDKFFLFNELGDLIVAKLTPERYEEVSRAHLLEPTGTAFGRLVLWSHPAFSQKRMVARNDKEIVCVSLAKE